MLTGQNLGHLSLMADCDGADNGDVKLARTAGTGDREPGRLRGHSLDNSVRPRLGACEGTSGIGTYTAAAAARAGGRAVATSRRSRWR